MEDVSRDISLLVSIARIESSLNEERSELVRLPARIAECDRKLADLDAREAAAIEKLESARKERRTLERQLQDDAEQIAKYKNQLMSVKTNREYTAMLKEIDNLEKGIDSKEERLLEVMDIVDEAETDNATALDALRAERDEVAAEKKSVEARVAKLDAEAKRLEEERPKLLRELDPALQKRYERLMGKYGDVAVANLDGESCGGCHTQLPPQVGVEVRQNNQIMTCQSCGRILVHFAD